MITANRLLSAALTCCLGIAAFIFPYIGFVLALITLIVLVFVFRDVSGDGPSTPA